MKHGQGTMEWPNGDKYEGEWISDKLSGQGCLTYHDGSVYRGRFINGSR